MVDLRRLLTALAIAAAPVGLPARGASAQSGQAARPTIPDGEAHFSPSELEDYYRVYENGDVRYLRRLFDAYLAGKSIDDDAARILRPWDRAYLRSKLIVMSRDESPFGVTFILLVAQDRPDRVLRAAVYKRSRAAFVLRGLDDAGFSSEDVRKLRVRYRQFLEDKKHAL